MNRFLKHLGNAWLVGTLIFIIIMAILYASGVYPNGISWAEAWEEYYEGMIFSLIIYCANAIWIQYLLNTYKYDLFTPKRFIKAILGNIGFSLIGIFISKLILLVGIQNQPLLEFLEDQEITDYRISLFISIVVALIFYSVWYYKYRQENKVKEQKIIAGTASAKFDALKNQLDPHFLFNSLNVLTSLIDEDPNQAQKFTTSLSKVYRYVLEQKNKDLVSVDEELQFARTYVKLLKMRFEDSIVLDIPEKAINSEAKIVPLSLQLLLENAVKHNIVTSAKPLHIRIYEEEGLLKVTNNLQEKQVVKKSSGVGLQNIKQRYDLLSNRNMEIFNDGTNFTVQLPMLTQQVSVVETQEEFIDDKRYQKAKEKVEAVKGFYGNLIAYCIVIPCLALLNYKTTSFPWVIFPILGWGFGLLTHGMEAFGYNPLWGKRWEEKKLRELMDKEDF